MSDCLLTAATIVLGYFWVSLEKQSRYPSTTPQLPLKENSKGKGNTGSRTESWCVFPKPSCVPRAFMLCIWALLFYNSFLCCGRAGSFKAQLTCVEEPRGSPFLPAVR